MKKGLFKYVLFLFIIVFVLSGCKKDYTFEQLGIKKDSSYLDIVEIFGNAGEHYGSGHCHIRWNLSNYVSLVVFLETGLFNMPPENDYSVERVDLGINFRGSKDTGVFHCLESADKYNEYIKKTEIPQDFLYYEQIKSLGRFNGISFLCPYSQLNYNSYSYSITDENNYIYNFYVDNGIIKTKDCCKIAKKINTLSNDLRTCEETGVCYAEIGKAEYTYIFGKLSSISWINGNKTMAVVRNGELGSEFPEAMFSDYPINSKETVLSKLLSKDTAADMIEKLSKSDYFK